MELNSFFRYFVITGLINSILFAFFVLFSGRTRLNQILLILLVLLLSLQAFLNAFDSPDFFILNPHFIRISWLVLSILGPLIFLFVKKTAYYEEKMNWKDLLHCIPFFLTLFLLLPVLVNSKREKLYLITDFGTLSAKDFGWLNQANLLAIMTYIIAGFYLLYRLKRITSTEVYLFRLTWLRRFINILVIIIVISTLGFYGRALNIPVLENIYHYNYALVVLLIYWLTYNYIRYPDLMISAGRLFDHTTKYKKSGLSESLKISIYQNVTVLFSSEKVFLKSDLGIENLSYSLQIPRHHLSQAINELSGKSFNEFVNTYRVEEVKKRLQDPTYMNLSILGIALDSGFNSKSSFNATFKRITGLTPSTYNRMQKISGASLSD